ncbi:alpha/beta hydrolase [Aneurinibacillus migulanus]|uniref:alpha/beta fold hydrolase n=1 Tax=Aneurinibacillus migulanus TaxID=47500 RepID=UPI002E1F2B44|nr:alpha/beta hydrolase [Aneurinibacillus migulanus]
MAGCYITGGSGTALYVEDTGNRYGKPIVFIHGFSQSLLCWKKQLQSHMAKEFRLVAMDIRGHGWSEKPIEEYDSPKNYADDIQAVIKTLKLRHPILVGWSRGGALVCDYLQYYGEGRAIFQAFILYRRALLLEQRTKSALCHLQRNGFSPDLSQTMQRRAAAPCRNSSRISFFSHRLFKTTILF